MAFKPKIFLLAANLGSLFEDPDHLIPSWCKEFEQNIIRVEPSFIAIHCQEVGGKDFQQTMQNASIYIKQILSLKSLENFDRLRIYLDEDFTVDESFTALGNIYLVRRDLQDVNLWDFKKEAFSPLLGKEIYAGNIEDVSSKEKIKFPKDYFPQSPSEYCLFRRAAFQYALDHVEQTQRDGASPARFFIFGDMNFRLDGREFVQTHLSTLYCHQCLSKRDSSISRFEYKATSKSQVLVEIGKKEFKHKEHNKIFRDHYADLIKFDKETIPFLDRLYEYEIDFPPTYPWSENPDEGGAFNSTRMPGWTDRILVSRAALSLISNNDRPVYSAFGTTYCTGDHKPVFLGFCLKVTTDSAPSKLDHPTLCRNISLNGTTLTTDQLHPLSLIGAATFKDSSKVKLESMQADNAAGDKHRPTIGDIAKNIRQTQRVIKCWSDRARHHSSSGSDDDDPFDGSS